MYYLCTTWVCCCPSRPEEGIRAPGTGVRHGYEPHGRWESNLCPLEEPQMLRSTDHLSRTQAVNLGSCPEAGDEEEDKQAFLSEIAMEVWQAATWQE